MQAKSNYNKLILLTIAAAILIIISSIFIQMYFHSRIEKTRVDQYLRHESIIATQTASSLKDFMEHVKLELNSMPGDSNELSADAELFSNYHRSLISSIRSLIRVDAEGRVINESSPILNRPDLSKEAIFYHPKSSGSSYITSLSQGGHNYLLISVPVYLNTYGTKSFDGVRVAVLDVTDIGDLYLSQIKVGVEGNVWAIGEDGTIFAPPNYAWLSLREGDNYFSWVKDNYPDNIGNANSMAVQQDGQFVDDWGKYGKTLTSFSQADIGNEKWIIAVSTPYSELVQGIEELQQQMLYILVLLIFVPLLGLTAFIFVLRSKEQAEVKLEKATVALEKLGITRLPDDRKYELELKENRLYLIKERFDKVSLQVFNSMVGARKGLIVTRDAHEDTGNVEYLMLSASDGEAGVSTLIRKIQAIIGKGQYVILIERLDYLISRNGFDKVLRFIQNLKDILDNDIVIISINPTIISDKEAGLLESECQDLTNLIELEKPKLPKDLIEIIQYIDNQNSQKRKVFFKNISKDFNITKPTTKKKLDELHRLGLIQIEEHGRVKSLAITEQGITFLKSLQS